MACCVVRGSVRDGTGPLKSVREKNRRVLGVSCFVCGIIEVSVSSERKK